MKQLEYLIIFKSSKRQSFQNPYTKNQISIFDDEKMTNIDFKTECNEEEIQDLKVIFGDNVSPTFSLMYLNDNDFVGVSLVEVNAPF